MANQKFTAEEVIKALEKSRGLVTVTARRLSCSPQTVKNYADRYPTVKQAMRDQRDVFIDNTEIRLIEAVESRAEPWAIALVLKTLGKERGYVERTEQTGKDGAAITYAHRVDLSGLSDDELDILEGIAARTTRPLDHSSREEPPASS